MAPPGMVGPESITVGPGGYMWVTEPSIKRVVRLSRSGEESQNFALPSANGKPQSIVFAVDGGMWFALSGTNKLGRMSPEGFAAEFPVADAASRPVQIAAIGTSIWYTDSSTNRIGKFEVSATLPIIPTLPSAQKALQLNGTTAYAEVAAASDLNLTRDWTVEASFKDTDPNGFNHDYRQILMKGDKNANAEAPYYLLIGNNSLLAGSRTRGQDYPVTVNLAQIGVDASTWHDVAATFDAGKRSLKVYLDGALVGSGALPAHSQAGNNLPLQIGRNGPKTGKYWLGELDDVRLFNTTLTDVQVQETHLDGAALDRTVQGALVASWRFEDIEPSSGDSSGLGHTANLLGGASLVVDERLAAPVFPTLLGKEVGVGTTSCQMVGARGRQQICAAVLAAPLSPSGKTLTIAPGDNFRIFSALGVAIESATPGVGFSCQGSTKWFDPVSDLVCTATTTFVLQPGQQVTAFTAQLVPWAISSFTSSTLRAQP
jgi:hypothetical protein